MKKDPALQYDHGYTARIRISPALLTSLEYRSCDEFPIDGFGVVVPEKKSSLQTEEDLLKGLYKSYGLQLDHLSPHLDSGELRSETGCVLRWIAPRKAGRV